MRVEQEVDMTEFDICHQKTYRQTSRTPGEEHANLVQKGCRDEQEPDLERLGDELESSEDILVFFVKTYGCDDGVRAECIRGAMPEGTPDAGSDDMLFEVEDEKSND